MTDDDHDDVENYAHLWASDGPWALLHLNPGKEQEEAPRYQIVDRFKRIALVIEDDDVAVAVKQRMLAAGVPVVTVGNGF